MPLCLVLCGSGCRATLGTPKAFKFVLSSPSPGAQLDERRKAQLVEWGPCRIGRVRDSWGSESFQYASALPFLKAVPTASLQFLRRQPGP